MASNASRGAAAKSKTKKWLEARGYQVAYLEVVRFIWRPVGPPLPVKRDQFGSDLLAMNAEQIIFVQVKSGQSAEGGTFPQARREFAKHIYPSHVRRVIVAWPFRARQPRVMEVWGAKAEHLLEPSPLFNKSALS